MIKLMGVLIAVILCAGSAYAVPTLVINSGTATVTITDGSGLDANGLSGDVTYIGSVGGWTINITTGVIGVNPTMDVNSQDLNSGSSDPLTITFSDPTQLVTGPAGFSALLGTTSLGGTITYNVLVDGSPVATILGPSGSATGSLSSGSHVLAEQVILDGPGTTQFDASLTVPDAGTTVMLLGVSLTALGFFGRSRKSVRS